MEERLTEELLKELLEAPSASSFIEDRQIEGRTVSDYLNQLLEDKGLVRSDVVNRANIGATYGYLIFQGQRQPSRDKLLALAFAMELNVRECNRLLRAGGHSELYCKNRRDAILVFALAHGYSLLRADEELCRLGEESICERS